MSSRSDTLISDWGPIKDMKSHVETDLCIRACFNIKSDHNKTKFAYASAMDTGFVGPPRKSYIVISIIASTNKSTVNIIYLSPP